MELTSISEFCQINLGGLQIVEYAPVDWIDAGTYRRLIKADTYNWQEAIPFASGKDWLRMPLLPQSKPWNENQVDSENGPLFEQQIAGIIPGVNPTASGMLMEMTGYRYIVKIQARNGHIFLVGTIDEGLAFTAPGTTSDQSGLNNYAITFRGQTSRRAHGYVPA